MRLRLCLAATALLCVSLAAHADTFLYIVNFSLPGFISNATFTSPEIITTPNTTVSATGTSTFGDVQSVTAFPPAGSCPLNTNFACFITTVEHGSNALYFAQNVESVGTFTDVFGDGTVTITDLGPTTTVTPEPSSIALLGTGMFGLAGVLRKRFC